MRCNMTHNPFMLFGDSSITTALMMSRQSVQNALLESGVKVRQTQPVPRQENKRQYCQRLWRPLIPPSARLLCGWVSPSLQLLKCSGVYQQVEAVIVDVNWMLVVLWVHLPVLYFWKHICSAVVNSVSKNKTRTLKYLLLICLVSAKFELDTVFWIIEWHRLAMDLKTDLLVFCVSSILLKLLLFNIRKLSLIKHDVLRCWKILGATDAVQSLGTVAQLGQYACPKLHLPAPWNSWL